MSIIVLQNALLAFAALNPKTAFETLDGEVTKIAEWEEERVVAGMHDDEEASRLLHRFTLRQLGGPDVEPTMVSTRKEGYTDPEYLIADYVDGTRVIELPEDEVALYRGTVDGRTVHAVMRYVNQPGMGFVAQA